MNSLDEISDPDAEEKNDTIRKQPALGGDHYLEAIKNGDPQVGNVLRRPHGYIVTRASTVFLLRRSGTKSVVVADYGHLMRRRLKIDHDCRMANMLVPLMRAIFFLGQGLSPGGSRMHRFSQVPPTFVA